MRFEIPNSFLPGFKILAGLNTEEAANLGSVLDHFPVGGNLQDLEQAIKEKSQVKLDSSVAKTIFSLEGLLLDHEDDKEQLASDLTAAFKFQNEADDTGNLETNLTILFQNSHSLKKTFKAYNLLSENANHFQDSRIISDMRMVFDKDFEEKSKTGLCVHQLKLEYIGDKEEKELYISLDGNDLLKLKAEIDRALKKEKILENNFKEINFINLR